MLTPQELRKISEVAAKEKSQKEQLEKAKREEANIKQKAESVILTQAKASVAIAHAEYNMDKVAHEGLCAALINQIEDNEVAEQTLRSLGTKGAVVDSPDKYFCQGAAKIVFDHFKDKKFSVVIVSQAGPIDAEGNATKKYFIKVGW